MCRVKDAVEGKARGGDGKQFGTCEQRSGTRKRERKGAKGVSTAQIKERTRFQRVAAAFVKAWQNGCEISSRDFHYTPVCPRGTTGTRLCAECASLREELSNLLTAVCVSIVLQGRSA